MSARKMLLLAVVVAGLLIYIAQVELKKDNAKAEKETPFAALNLSTLKEIKVKNSSDSFTLNYKGASSAPVKEDEENKITYTEDEVAKWQIASIPEADIDPAPLNALIGAIKNLKLEQLPAEQAQADLSVYGLKEPLIELEIVNSSGQKKLLMGELNEVISQRYFSLTGEPGTFIGTDEIYRAASRRLSDFRTRSVIKFADSAIASYEQSTTDGKVLKLGPSQDRGWTVLSPGPYTADSVTVGNVFREVRNLRVSEFIDGADKNSSQYGLDKPEILLKVTFKEEQKREPLEIKIGVVPGASEKETVSYMALGNKSTIFKLNEDPTTKIVRPIFDLREKSPLTVEANSIEELTIERSGEQLISIKRDKDVWMVGDKQGDQPFIEQLRRDIADLQAEDFPTESVDFGFGAPTAKVTLKSKEGAAIKEHTILIGARAPNGIKDSERYYAGVDERKEPFIIGASAARKIAPKLEVLLASEQSSTATAVATPSAN